MRQVMLSEEYVNPARPAFILSANHLTIRFWQIGDRRWGCKMEGARALGICEGPLTPCISNCVVRSSKRFLFEMLNVQHSEGCVGLLELMDVS
jgi:hypothetical protein